MQNVNEALACIRFLRCQCYQISWRLLIKAKNLSFSSVSEEGDETRGRNTVLFHLFCKVQMRKEHETNNMKKARSFLQKKNIIYT